MIDKTRATIDRGIHAKRLSEDPHLAEAFSLLEKNYIDNWRAQPDSYKREQQWYRINALEDLRRHLMLAIKNGESAQRDLDEANKRK